MIRRTRRPGFTLVELLVAITLAAVILGLGVAVTQTSAFDSYKTVGAADKLSQWMLVAKNRALRDRAPRGIRLIPDATNPEFIKEVAYIEQPDPIPANGPLLLGSRLVFYYPAQVVETTTPSPGTFNVNHLENLRAVFLAGMTPAQQAEFSSTVQPGDIISVPELRAVFKIGNPVVLATGTPAVGDASPGRPTMRLNIAATALPDLGRAVYSYDSTSTRDGLPHPNIPTPLTNSGTLTTTAFSIIRSPRPVLGEPTQPLPNSMAVDVRTSIPNPAPTPPTPVLTSLNPPPADTNGNRDILFSPSGEVVGATEALTLFLVRDVNLPNVVQPLTTDYERAGQMILICIYNKTGAISTQPVNPPPATDPYRFAKDGINTGL